MEEVINWEQRKFEIVKELLNSEYLISVYKEEFFYVEENVHYVTSIADKIIKEIKKEEEK